jgi:hypothetical protein
VKRAPLILLLAVAALFVIMNRAAYQGYFQDDELDDIVTTRNIPALSWAGWFATPRLSKENFRPTGHLYFYAMNRLVGLDFPKYVAVLHGLHLLNVMLVWLLLRQLGVNPFAAVAGAAFFALNVSAFDALWKPMYVFDVLCGTFCLATLVLYAEGYWIESILTMWLAYKSKELAIMLPLVLLAYEAWFGERRWHWMTPFFAISLCFGVQAILSPQPKESPYELVWTFGALWQTFSYYSTRVLLIPFAGIVFAAIPVLVKDRRVWFGAVALGAFSLPLLFLPGRIFPAYTYLPLSGAAIELAVLASIVRPVATVAFFALWIPWNLVELRADRKATLTADDQIRIYAGALLDFRRNHPELRSIAFSSAPDSFHIWGIQAALNYESPFTRLAPKFMDEAEARKLPDAARVTFINWDRNHNKVHILSKDPSAPDASYLKLGPETPIWQLDQGWLGLDEYFRWTEPTAKAHLAWPADSAHFEIAVNVSPSILKTNGYVNVRPSINGHDLGSLRFDKAGVETLRWDLPKGREAKANVELTFEPVGHFPPDTRTLGAPIVAFGFVP